MIPPNASLVKYDNPVLVSKNTVKVPPKIKGLKTQSPRGSPTPQATKGSETEEILNAILPPKEWSEGGQLWVQQVSSTPATRLDVVTLQEELDRRLQIKQARETGICPVRRELYSQCFDELIRQVTINCAERGLLLLRVRDEIRMTIAAYQTLYESSVAFGMRKALQAERNQADMEKKISELEQSKRDHEEEVRRLKAKVLDIEEKSSQDIEESDRNHQADVQFLKKTNQQLKGQLDGILGPKKTA